MTYLNCTHCNLAIHVRAAYLAPRNCPRCIARRQVAVPMYEAARPARLVQLRRASPPSGTDPAA